MCVYYNLQVCGKSKSLSFRQELLVSEKAHVLIEQLIREYGGPMRPLRRGSTSCIKLDFGSKHIGLKTSLDGSTQRKS